MGFTMPSFSPEEEVLHDYSPFLFHYKSGQIHRLIGLDVVPACIDSQTGVESKDVIISPEINLSARLFRPKSASPGQKLPLLVFFHGGGFIIESAFLPVYTKHLNIIVSEANVIAVSVDYRRAPEHPLPAAYEDSWLSLKWIRETSDEWIQDCRGSEILQWKFVDSWAPSTCETRDQQKGEGKIPLGHRCGADRIRFHWDTGVVPTVWTPTLKLANS